jgi:hypothetical protein
VIHLPPSKEIVMSPKPPCKATWLPILACAWLCLAGETGTAEEPRDQQVVKTKATKRAVASTVNFKQQLGLAYPSLGTLGSRIEAARRAPDPVALAHAASEPWRPSRLSLR